MLKKRVLAYYKVVVKNLREVIPKNIKRTVLEAGIKNIEYEIFQASHNEPEKVKEWLKPSASNYQERVLREKEFQTLLKAEQYLLTHPAFSKIRVQDVKKRRVEREKEMKEIEEKMAAKKKLKKIEESPIETEEKAETPKKS